MRGCAKTRLHFCIINLRKKIGSVDFVSLDWFVVIYTKTINKRAEMRNRIGQHWLWSRQYDTSSWCQAAGPAITSAIIPVRMQYNATFYPSTFPFSSGGYFKIYKSFKINIQVFCHISFCRAKNWQCSNNNRRAQTWPLFEQKRVCSKLQLKICLVLKKNFHWSI